MNFAVIDIIFGVIVLLCAVRCMISGFIREFFSKLALLGGAFAGLLFYRLLSPVFPPSLPLAVINVASFLIIFIVSYIVIRIVEKIVGLAFRGEILGGLDRALGLFLGLFEGLLITSLLLLVLTAQPFFNARPLLDGSFFYRLLVPLIAASNTVFKGFARL